MFSRVKEAKRILMPPQPVPPQHLPDIIAFSPEAEWQTPAGQKIALIVEIFLLIYVVGAALRVLLAPLMQDHSPAVSLTITGGLSLLVLWVTDLLSRHFQQTLQLKLRIKERIAPFFGHRIDRTIRVLRG